MQRYEDAISIVKEGLDESPGNPRLVPVLVWLYQTIWLMQKSDNPGVLDDALDMAEKAVAAEESLGNYLALSQVYLHRRQHEKAVAELDKAISLGADDWFQAEVLSYIGDSEKAIKMLERGSPAKEIARWYLNTLGLSYRLAGRKAEGVETLKRLYDHLLLHLDAFHGRIGLAILYAELGQLEEAQAEAAEILKLVPNFSVDVYGERVPYKDPAQAERDMAALRKAGLK